MDTFSLTPGQKDGLCRCLSAIEAGIASLREEIPELKDYSTEKVITFLQEVRVLQTLDTALKENFQPCASAHETALDAVGEEATVQIKEFAGDSPNTLMFRVRQGKKVSDYVREIIRKSGTKKAYFAVRNRRRQEICVVLAANFTYDDTTYLNWNQLTHSRNARVIAG